MLDHILMEFKIWMFTGMPLLVITLIAYAVVEIKERRKNRKPLQKGK